MASVIECPQCGARMKLRDEAIGKKVRCPECESGFIAAAKSAGDSAVTQRERPEGSSAAKRGPAKDGSSIEKRKSASPDATESGSRKPVSAKSDAPKSDAPKSDAPKSDAPKSDKPRPKKAEPEKPPEEEDWLGSLEELAPSSRGRPGSAGPPQVLGVKPKRKKSKPDDEGGAALRDEDGEMPLWLHRLLMVGSGFLGGILATAIWAGMIYWTGWESGYIAILVGACVGIGVRVGASKWDYGWGPAITASVIAVAALLIGKFLGVSLLLRQFTGEVQQFQQAYIRMMEYENYHVRKIADEIVESTDDVYEKYDWNAAEGFEENEDVDDVSGFAASYFDPESAPKRYPAALWKEASDKWNALPDEEKKKRRDAVKTEIEQARSGKLDHLGFDLDVAPDMFGPFDILWLVLGVSAAFRIAAGMTDDD